MNTWRAGCGESRTSGSEGGPGKPTSRKVDRAPWSDPYTYVATWSGFAYVAFVTDVYSRRIVGWNVAATLKADILPLQALDMAAWDARREGAADLTGPGPPRRPRVELPLDRLHRPHRPARREAIHGNRRGLLR